MSAFLRLSLLALLCVPSLFTSPAVAQEFKTTPAKELAANPQRFWLRGVVFRDELVEPVGKERFKVGDRIAHRFVTKVAGECYADESILSAIEQLTVGREYIFTASVSSKQTGFFSKKTTYMILVSGIIVPVADVGSISKDLEETLIDRAEINPLAKDIDLLKQLITRTQEGITALAATEQVDRKRYFDPTSAYFERFISTVRRMLNDLEHESKTPGREQYVQFVAALVALQEGALSAIERAPSPTTNTEERVSSPEQQPDATPAAAPEIAPASEPTVEAPAEEPPANVKKPRKKRFWNKSKTPESTETAPQEPAPKEPSASSALEEHSAEQPEPAPEAEPEATPEAAATPSVEQPSVVNEQPSVEAPQDDVIPTNTEPDAAIEEASPQPAE